MDEELQVRAEGDEEFEDVQDDALESLKARVVKKKGRGFGDTGADFRGHFESVDDSGAGPLRSVEGWIVFVSNIHEEAQEDDIQDKFAEYGEIKNLHVNLDRRTGFLKGYALVEYETYKEASTAIEKLNASRILGQQIAVDWAFTKPARTTRRSGRR